MSTLKFTSATRCGRSPLQLSLLAFLLALSITIQPALSVHHPLMLKLDARENQCIYERFERGDFATFEIFIVEAEEGGTPHAGVQIEGPVISPKVGQLDGEGNRSWEPPKAKEGEDEEGEEKKKKRRTNSMGAAMQDGVEEWPNFVNKMHKHFTDAGIIFHSYFIDYTHSGESEDAVAARADWTRKQNEEEEALKRRKMYDQKTKGEGGYTGDEDVEKEVYEEAGSRIQHIIPEWIEPYEWTKPIKAAGWYRMCVTADDSITVELDIRSSADLGGIDPDTGHVFTHDEREFIDEEKRILGEQAKTEEARKAAEELERALQGQVKDFHLETTRKLMAEVNRLVADMQKRQTAVHHRIKSHESDARRNRRRISQNGKIVSVLVVAITVLQMYTVRKWLLSRTTLGLA
ncbi:hypothetical protein ACHAXT_004890 [Thalassiosira profunda]